MELPKAFCARMARLLGEEAEAFFASFEKPPVRALRFLPQRGNAAAFLQEDFSLAPVPYAENAYYFEKEGVGNTFWHRGGAIYIQEPAAMAPVAALEIAPDFKILDLCAAPGGKSAQAAAFLGEEGVLVSNEVVPSRCRILLQNCERLGIRNSVVLNAETGDLARFYGSYFDLVICDAPCSGEGMMRKNPEAIAEWSESAVLRCAERQAAILQNAARLVKPGGFLLYATCTYAVEENEAQVAAFLKRENEFSLVPVRKAVQSVTEPGISLDGAELSFCRRFYPQKAPGEGQFLALLQKSADAVPAPCRAAGKKEAKKSGGLAVARAFLQEVLEKMPAGELLEAPDGVYLAPKIPLPEKGVFSPGVKLGAVQKGRFVPHHRLFMTYADLFRSKVSLARGDARIERYLRGEEIEAEGGGWAVVLAENCPLGGVKISGGKAKNHLPKGLRAG